MVPCENQLSKSLELTQQSSLTSAVTVATVCRIRLALFHSCDPDRRCFYRPLLQIRSSLGPDPDSTFQLRPDWIPLNKMLQSISFLSNS